MNTRIEAYSNIEKPTGAPTSPHSSWDWAGIRLALVPLISILAGPRRYSTALAFLFGLSTVLHKVNAWVAYFLGHPLIPIGYPG